MSITVTDNSIQAVALVTLTPSSINISFTPDDVRIVRLTDNLIVVREG